MQTFRVKIKLCHSFATPLFADTIFGGLCWTIRYLYGLGSLENFIEKYRRGDPPLVLSNAFPGDLLPKPLGPFIGRPVLKTCEQLIDWMGEAKRIKKITYISVEEFIDLVSGRQTCLQSRDAPYSEAAVLHNRLNRFQNSTAGDGNLYEELESYLHPDYEYMSIYIKTPVNTGIDWREVFSLLGETGIGRKKSSGKGAFKLVEIEPFSALSGIDGVNAFVSLSNFVPGPKDPTDGWYKAMVKYGKLGEEYANLENPFKKPLLMLKAGAVFRITGGVREYYGSIVENISSAYNNIIHYGLAFPVPARIEEAGQ